MTPLPSLSPQARKFALCAAIALALVGGGYAFGRYAQPARVEVKTHETVKTVTDTSAQEQVKRLLAQVEDLKRDTHRVDVTVSHKDGTTEHTVTTDTHVEEEHQTHADTTQTTQQASHQTQTVDLSASKVTVFERPQWRVGALVGVDLHGSVSYGAEVSRRILGPVSVSVLVLTDVKSTALVAAGVSVEF